MKILIFQNILELEIYTYKNNNISYQKKQTTPNLQFAGDVKFAGDNSIDPLSNPKKPFAAAVRAKLAQGRVQLRLMTKALERGFRDIEVLRGLVSNLFRSVSFIGRLISYMHRDLRSDSIS